MMLSILSAGALGLVYGGTLIMGVFVFMLMITILMR